MPIVETLGVANPFRDHAAYDKIYLAGVLVPCARADVEATKRENKIDVKAGPGTQGDTTTYRGFKIVEATITLYFFDLADGSYSAERQIDDWQAFRSTLEYAAGTKKTQAFDVLHPKLADLATTGVLIKSIGTLDHQGGMLFTLAIEVVEYRPPAKTNATSTPSTIAGGAAGAGGTPNLATNPSAGGAEDRQLAKLQAELAELP